MELRQLQLQLTDLKFSRRKDEPEDWSPGHWAGYGRSGAWDHIPCAVNWMNWMSATPPLAKAHGGSVTETIRGFS